MWWKDFDWSIAPRVWTVGLIYAFLWASLGMVLAILFETEFFVIAFWGLMAMRLFALAGDGFLSQERRDRREARMPAFVRHVWDVKFFALYSIALLLVMNAAVVALSLDDQRAGMGVAAVGVVGALYFYVTKGLTFR